MNTYEAILVIWGLCVLSFALGCMCGGTPPKRKHNLPRGTGHGAA